MTTIKPETKKLVLGRKKKLSGCVLIQLFQQILFSVPENNNLLAANEVQCHTNRKRELTTSFAISWTSTKEGR